MEVKAISLVGSEPTEENGLVRASVFLLWHQHDEDEEGMLLGVYSSEERAAARLETAKRLPGFRRFPDAFTISRYEVDKDEWTEGFATFVNGAWVDDPDVAD